MRRRGFLRWIFGALFGAGGAATLLDPLLRRGRPEWRDAGGLGGFEEGTPTPYRYEVRAGWERRRETALVVRRGESVDVFSARCTHAGCTVRSAEGEFRCPCHGGAFDLSGAPIRGPAKEPLRRIEARVEEGRVRIRA